MWYHETVGKQRCPIVDTWWQTETGAIMMVTLPGATPAKPGSTGLPFFGVVPEVVTSDGEARGRRTRRACSCCASPGPAMLRTIWGDDERFVQQYFSEIPGSYFTGDGARRTQDGYFQVVGRIDDVLNVAGHRIGTAEIESALVSHPAVAEAAAVGRPDEHQGPGVGRVRHAQAGLSAAPRARRKSCATTSGKEIGKFAAPDDIRFADSLPKTRSGKIMRRLLKDIAAGRETQGDISTLEDLQRAREASADRGVVAFLVGASLFGHATGRTRAHTGTRRPDGLRSTHPPRVHGKTRIGSTLTPGPSPEGRGEPARVTRSLVHELAQDHEALPEVLELRVLVGRVIVDDRGRTR